MADKTCGVTCTWGDGPDILLTIQRQPQGGRCLYDLTLKEAEELAWQLNTAIRQVKELEEMAANQDQMAALQQ